MPIGKKKSKVATTKKTSKSNTPRFTPKELGITKRELLAAHEAITEAKVATSAVKQSEGKLLLQERSREKQFDDRVTAFYADLGDGKLLLVKPSTRRYPLTANQAEEIEEIIEGAGYDAGDYYHESHKIELDADAIYDRLGERAYGKLQAEVAALMSKFGCGDCWEIKEEIIARPEMPEKRLALPKDVNLAIEAVKPMTISVEAKEEL
jgi:hypothetical protein